MNPVHDCPFCAIACGTAPAEIVWQTPDLVAFKSLGRRAGRLLVVPRTHYESFADAPKTSIGAWFQSFAQLAAARNVPGYKVQVNSGGAFSRVRHLHFHFIYSEKD